MVTLEEQPVNRILTMYIIQSYHFWFQKGHGHKMQLKMYWKVRTIFRSLKSKKVTYHGQGQRMQLKKTLGYALAIELAYKKLWPNCPWRSRPFLGHSSDLSLSIWFCQCLCVVCYTLLAFSFSSHKLLSSQSWPTLIHVC